MAVALSASLAGSGVSAKVIVTVTGLTPGTTAEVTRYVSSPVAVTLGPLIGGRAQLVEESSLVLVDPTPPMGVDAVFYQVSVDGVSAASDSVAGPAYPGRHVLSDSRRGSAVLFDQHDNGDPIGNAWRGSLVQVAGRANPVPVSDGLRGGSAGRLQGATRDAAETASLVALLATGEPVVLRTHPGCRDLPLWSLIQPLDTSRVLLGWPARRVWSFDWVAVDMPDPDVPIRLATNGEAKQGVSGTNGDAKALVAGTNLNALQVDWAAL